MKKAVSWPWEPAPILWGKNNNSCYWRRQPPKSIENSKYFRLSFSAYEMKSHPKKIIVIFLILSFIISGCGSLATLNLSFSSEERKRIFCEHYLENRNRYFEERNLHSGNDEFLSEFSLSTPYVYSGSKSDFRLLASPFFGGWKDTLEAVAFSGGFFLLIYPLIAVDFCLSIVGDTILLPYTIPMQFAKGNLIDPPYFAMGQWYYEAENIDDALRYYEKGVQILPKYYDDDLEADRCNDLKSIFYTMARLYEKKDDYENAISLYG